MKISDRLKVISVHSYLHDRTCNQTHPGNRPSWAMKPSVSMSRLLELPFCVKEKKKVSATGYYGNRCVRRTGQFHRSFTGNQS